MTTRDMLITTEEFEAHIRRPENIERRIELIDGEIIEKTMPTDEHGYITAKYAYFFVGYFEDHPEIAGRVTVAGRYRPTSDRYNDRIPDISIIVGERPFVKRGTADFMPDICIEIQSPDDSLKKLREKAHFYIANGAKYSLITLPQKRAIELFSADGEDQHLTVAASDVVTFGDLLPGFSVPVARLSPTE
jgi:Uma2 family endonuclease